MSTPLKANDSVLIIGAGLIGLGIAWKLAQQGTHVTIVDAHHAGYGASSAAAGMLAATAEVNFEEEELLKLNHLSAQHYPEFIDELQSLTQVDLDFRTHGSLVIGLDRDDTEALQRLLRYQQQLDLNAQMLSGEEARELEPALAPSVHSAVLCPQDYQVNPILLVEGFKKALSIEGATLREHTPIKELILSKDERTVLGARTESGEDILADRTLVAAGAWTRRLLGVKKQHLPRIRPVLGQMLALQMEDEPICNHVIRAPDAYLIPRSNGELIIGASMEERGFTTTQRAGSIFELLRGAWETMPGIYDLPFLRTWTGYRPMSLHNEPVLGPSPALNQLWFATGHGRNGVLLTAITAREMSRSLQDGKLTTPLLPFKIR